MNDIAKYVEGWVKDPSFILRRGLSGQKGKVGMLVFEEFATPKLYVKIARFRGPNRSIRRERGVLEKVQGESIPKIIFFKESDGRDILGLEGKPGFSMLSEILGQEDRRRTQSLRFLEMGFSWLKEFRKSGWAHGDFCPKNLLVDGEKLNVVDWEYAFPDADPTFDLFYYCLKFGYWLFGQKRSNGRNYAFKKAFLEENWFSQRVKNELSKFKNLRKNFFAPLLFQVEKEFERTGVKNNFWVDLLDYAREHEEEIL